MKTKLLKYLLLIAFVGAPWLARASGEGVLANLDLTNLEKQASERVKITLDKPMLDFAARFLEKDDPDTEKVQTIIKDLEGIYVRVFSFEHGKAYSETDVDNIRKQLGPDWSRLVEVRGRENVDFYVKRDGEKIKGFILISAEPSELVLVNIQGSIRPEQLNELEGFAGIPRGMFKSDKAKEKGKNKPLTSPKENSDAKSLNK